MPCPHVKITDGEDVTEFNPISDDSVRYWPSWVALDRERELQRERQFCNVLAHLRTYEMSVAPSTISCVLMYRLGYMSVCMVLYLIHMKFLSSEEWSVVMPETSAETERCSPVLSLKPEEFSLRGLYSGKGAFRTMSQKALQGESR